MIEWALQGGGAAERGRAETKGTESKLGEGGGILEGLRKMGSSHGERGGWVIFHTNMSVILHSSTSNMEHMGIFPLTCQNSQISGKYRERLKTSPPTATPFNCTEKL